MPLLLRPLFLACLTVAVLPPAVASAEFLRGSGPRGDEVRQAVEAHRASQRDQIQREESAAGRRLTPAERAEMREQLRSQWSPRPDVTQTADSVTAPATHPGGPQNAGGGWRAFWPWASPRQ